jgi:uncharacterized protein YndB with AHSA1/START domain
VSNSRLESSIVIDRPVKDVFAFVSNSENRPKWVRVSEVKKLTKGPIREGTTFSNKFEMSGRQWESKLEVVEYSPNKKYSFRTDAPFALQLDHFFKSVAGATEVTLRVDVEYSGVTRLLRPLLVRMNRKQMKSDLVALKKCLEGRAG